MKRILCLVLLLAAAVAAGAQEMNSLMFRARVQSPEISEKVSLSASPPPRRAS